MTGAVILAGGKSERMGSPKALLTYGGRTFLERILAVIDESGLRGPCLVVAGKHVDEIRSHAQDVPVVFNPDHEQGMTTSFQAGIRALGDAVEGAVVFLVDHPLVRASTVRALHERAGEADVVLPTFEGRRGHPVLLSRGAMGKILELPSDRGVNGLIRSGQISVVEVPVDDPGTLEDIDTPEDLERVRRGGYGGSEAG